MNELNTGLAARLRMTWKAKFPDAVDRPVFLALMEFENSETGECFPSIDTLADLTQMGRSRVIRSLQRLTADGFIQRHRRTNAAGLKTSNVYSIDWPAVHCTARDSIRLPYREMQCREFLMVQNEPSPMVQNEPSGADGSKRTIENTAENHDSPIVQNEPSMVQNETWPMVQNEPRTHKKNLTQEQEYKEGADVPPASLFASESEPSIPQIPTSSTSSKLKRSKAESQAMPEIPDTLDTPEFREAWSKWIQHRKEKRKPLTPTSAATKLKQLAKQFSPTQAAEAIEHSIGNGWEGIFPPQDTSKGFDHARSGSYGQLGNNRPAYRVPKPPGKRYTVSDY